MEDKHFELLEKLYVEFVGFKKEVNGRFDEVDKRFDKVEDRLTKLELSHERLEDKVTEAFEAIDTLAQTNQQQHEEIMRELKGDIGLVKLAVNKRAKKNSK